ncbi:DinB family protein [Mucilaginibacter sp. L3T2-6]|uniref:DinB family protein n=1 Tax=Mucilaginibacter sp. L3T2-6 TaxID=3062491 RepID=UPI0026748488|nr:DinB family protein [Mucilaginibacter sp. L3T2-6]MDO3643016.1 DinB family protein [Mucilaginibacter sp. L3T2-6]MDV6215783.1 DinB family protein [Mucilaginibacter sp. L3T2-6]
MKNLFIRLFNYDGFANEAILEALLKSSQSDEAVRLMAHLLAAQQIWYSRCSGSTMFAGPLWQDDGNINEFASTIKKNNADWLSYLDTLTDAEFDKIVRYNNLKGDPFENKLSDILLHVINHGTHHRAQIGQQLKFAGAETLPVTDYIAFCRQINS